MPELVKNLSEILKRAGADAKFRERLLANPSGVLSEFGVETSGAKPIAEYHEGYGVFLAIRLPKRQDDSSGTEHGEAKQGTSSSFHEDHFMDCHHF
jgi:hypothetical protein